MGREGKKRGSKKGKKAAPVEEAAPAKEAIPEAVVEEAAPTKEAVPAKEDAIDEETAANNAALI